MATVIFDSIADNKIRHRYVKWYTSEETFDRSSLSATLADGNITVKSYATILCVIKPTDEIIVNEVTINDRATATSTINALSGRVTLGGVNDTVACIAADVTITDAQFKDLINNPIQILPDPDAGKAYFFTSDAYVVVDTTAGLYTYPQSGDYTDRHRCRHLRSRYSGY